jgi:glycosyltransferase involved in cell wall biosynthesis
MNTSAQVVPRRLLMTADTVGGVWVYALELCRALGPSGVEIALATMGGRLTPAQYSEVQALSHVRLFESSYNLEWMDEPRADVEKAGLWLLGLEQEFRPDVVHLNSYSHGAFPWRARKVIIGHSCVLSWWRAVRQADAPPELDEYSESVMAGLHSADLVIAPSRAMLAALNEHYGPFRRSCVIPNGRSLAGLLAPPKQNLIFAAGRLWDEAKNISALVQVAPRLPWPVCLAGEDTHPNGRNQAHRGVNYAGRLSSQEIVRWYERASIYVLPARYEPFGLSVLEAAIAGCALVLGDIPSLREVWGDAARYVSPDDTDALEKTIRELIDSPETRDALATKARQIAATYTPEKMAADYLNAYRSVLAEHLAPPITTETAYANRDVLPHAAV